MEEMSFRNTNLLSSAYTALYLIRLDLFKVTTVRTSSPKQLFTNYLAGDANSLAAMQIILRFLWPEPEKMSPQTHILFL